MSDLRIQLQNRKEDSYFGYRVNSDLPKLSLAEQERFKTEAVMCYDRALIYLEKWFEFDNSPFKYFSYLNGKVIPSFEELRMIVELLKIESNGDELYAEYCLLKAAFPAIIVKEDMTLSDKWVLFFKNTDAPILLKIVQAVLAIPCSNAFVERVFSVMNNLWTDERNRLSVGIVKSELCIRYNLVYSCSEFYDLAIKNSKLIKAAKSNAKYTFKQ